MIKINNNRLFNQLINVASLLIIIYLANLISQFCWWLIKPLGFNLEASSITTNINSDKLAQSIANRAPFGIITLNKKEEVAPSIVDQIKLNGIYAAGPNNSVAFITIDNKESYIMTGGVVLNWQVAKILPDSVILKSQEETATIHLTSGSKSSINNNQPSFSSPNINLQPQNTNNRDEDYDNDIRGNSSQEQNSARERENQSPDELMEKRRKMIEEFQKQNQSNQEDQ